MMFSLDEDIVHLPDKLPTIEKCPIEKLKKLYNHRIKKGADWVQIIGRSVYDASKVHPKENANQALCNKI
jgi:hypothetical protein